MDSRRVCKSVASYDGLVGLYRHVHQAGNHPAGRVNLLRIDIGIDVDIMMTTQDHGNFLERSISGPLTDTVYRHFHLTGTVQDTADGIRRSHSQVVVAVGRQNGLVDAVYVINQIFDLGSVFFRKAIPRSIRNIHHRSSSLDNGFHYPGQVFIVRTAGILRIKLYILYVPACILHCCHCPFDDFLTCRIEFISDMRIRCTDTGMDTLALGIFQ